MTAWLLLALWLPATQHCGLETASLVGEHGSHPAAASCCMADLPGVMGDCAVVEGLFTRAAEDGVKILSPALLACTCLICRHLVVPVARREPVLARVAFERPLAWVPVWQFVRRAAPRPRAPSFPV